MDGGYTETLIADGFTREGLRRASKSKHDDAPGMIMDQLESLELIMDFVGGKRDLTPGYICEIHALITRSQRNLWAVNPSGQSVSVPLVVGQYKTQPNNPSTQSGVVHEYAPVEQVASEVERLVEIFGQIISDMHPVVVAAWLHHRFTQIHPFQDGNGRVARALASMVLLKEEFFPLHIRAVDRERYVAALREADDGRLDTLVRLIARRELEDMQLAVSEVAKIVAQRLGGGRTADVATMVAGDYARRRNEVLDRRSRVNDVSEKLVVFGARVLSENLEGARGEFLKSSVEFSFSIDYGGTNDGRGFWWKYQAVQVARRFKYWANLAENRYWIRSRLDLAGLRAQFVVLTHHVGREASGQMAAVAFAEIEPPDSVSHNRDEYGIVVCSETAFNFSEVDAGDRLERSFAVWLDESQAEALRALGSAAV